MKKHNIIAHINKIQIKIDNEAITSRDMTEIDKLHDLMILNILLSE